MTRRATPGAGHSIVGALVLSAVLAAPAFARSVADDYRQLQEQRYRGPVAIPEEGLIWRLDTAEWRFDRGELWLLEPLPSGAVTGMVFRGEGRFRMTVPDPRELQQLRRFVDEEELSDLETDFDRLVLRVSTPDFVARLGELLLDAATESETDELARRRHEEWLLMQGHDADARVLAAVRVLGDRYLRADMQTRDHGWLTYQYDRQLPEEIDLMTLPASGRWPVLESWLSLDDPRDRRADGTPSTESSPVVELVDVAVAGRLVEAGRQDRRGLGKVYPQDGEFRARVRFRALQDGVGALLLRLHPRARLEGITDARGEALDALRFRTGTLRLRRDRRDHNPVFAVPLPSPLARDELLDLTFEYRLELYGYGFGDDWYPTVYGAVHQPHTGRIAIEHRPGWELRAVGRPISTRREGRLVESVFEADRPSIMLGFTLARRPYEITVEPANLPPVTAFGATTGYQSPARIENVLEHVIGSALFFQERFESRLESPELLVTLIPALHGQAFDGFLHLGDVLSASYLPDPVRDKVIAHEVAHQWWGHRAPWASYRDQWLSEALAEYSALLYLEAEAKGGERDFRLALDAYTNELLGSFESSFNPFTSQVVVDLMRKGGRRIGPIGHGYRARTVETPTAYRTMSYRKGALVLHMIRMRLRLETGGDEDFFELLAELAAEPPEAGLSTRDLTERLERRLPQDDWRRFFDQWVYGTEIPSYRWATEVVAAASEPTLRIRLEQLEASPDFSVLLPLRVQYAEAREEHFFLPSDGRLAEIELVLDDDPVALELNPDHAVLAKMVGPSRRPGSTAADGR